MSIETAIILVFAGAFMVAVAGIPIVKKLAWSLGVVDKPDATRRIHEMPTPRLGGVAMYGAVLLALLVLGERYNINQLVSILIGATWVSFVGVLDDRWGVRPMLKFAAQIIAALMLIYTDVSIHFLPYPILNWGITIMWVVGLTNALNFLDNMDGLSGGISAIAAAFFLLLAMQNNQYLVGSLAAALLGACFGFLAYNFNPASIFMGDSGSLFLGFTLAALGIKLRFPGKPDDVTWMIPVMVMGVPIFDTTLVVISRIRRGLHPVTAGKDHTSHRLLRLGFTQREAVMALYLVGGMLGMVAIYISQSGPVEAYILGIAVFLAALYGIYRMEKIPPS